MGDVSIGVSVALVGMLGTLIALSIIGALVALIHRAFPFVDTADRGRPDRSG